MSDCALRTRRTPVRWLAASAILISAAAFTGCDAGSTPAGSSESSPGAQGQPAAQKPAVTLRANVRKGEQAVPVDRTVSLQAEDGTLRSVRVTSDAGALAGRMSGDHARWHATDRLEPGTTYTLHAVAEDGAGQVVRRTSRFHTQDLTLDQQTYASVAPLSGETVGVGMPVIVTFDVPVTDRAAFEKHMKVTATPAQPGAWHWLSDTEVHWRPKTYWRAGSDVHVDIDVNSVPAGGGVYGQESRQLDFHIGDAHVYKVNAQTDQMRVFSNGTLLRTIPITTGKPGFVTRSGTKVIIEKFPTKRMNSETVGIRKNNPEYYDLDDVRWAMRVTYSGEFLHAAPWSVASQGHENVSHGCTGMSTENAKWLFDMSRRGDVVEYTGTDRPMTLTNGYGDWNEPFATWKQGSALS